MDKASVINQGAVGAPQKRLRIPSPIIRIVQRLNRRFCVEDTEEQAFAREKQLLLKELDETLLNLRCARMNFEQASSPEIIEACIYEIKSAESRYNFLLTRAKRMGVNQSYLRARERTRRP